MILRDAAPRDAPAIAAIWNQIIRDTDITFTTEEKTVPGLVALIGGRHAAGQGFLVLCDAQDGVQGFATYGPFRAGPGYARTMEHSLHLAPECRGNGRGGSLLSALEAHARAAGVHSLIGVMTGTNTVSLSLHQRHGYAEVGRIPEVGWKFGRFHTAIFMQKRL